METEAFEQILTVSQLTREIREVLEGHVGSVWVQGEISNHRLQASGHQYFTLKDAGAQISCVLFRGAARAGARLMDGAQVQVQGAVSVYEPRGQYQLVVRQVRMKGQGGLQARFEALKNRLFEEGLFDPALKKAVPRLPETVALVTSPTGAAIQDMLNILSRRAPWVRVLVFPVRVQGQGAELETVRALQILNEAASRGLPRVDTIVIGRGGGSLEDLWAYNEEALARAIRSSKIPVISAVGHEIDFTIADLAADLRAPTPSAAAELLAPDAAELGRHLESARRSLCARVSATLDQHTRVLDLTARGGLTRGPQWLLQLHSQALDDAEAGLEERLRAFLLDKADLLSARSHALALRHPRDLVAGAARQMELAGSRFDQAARLRLDRCQSRLDALGGLLRGLGPQAVLARGFSYTTDAQGRVLKNSGDISEGEVVITRLAEGSFESVVRKG